MRRLSIVLIGSAIGLVVIAAGVHRASPAQATVAGSNGKLAFLGASGIYTTRPSGGGETFVVDGGAPAWSPEGRKLAFFRRLPGPCAPCNFAIHVLDLSTHRETKVFEGTTFDPAPAWSPDGRKLAFTNQRNGVDEIWLVNVDGTGATQLTSTGDNFHPAWSPDGTRVAFDGFEGASVHIYVVKQDGTELRQLTSGGASLFDLRPSWSPDGSKIAYESNHDGSFEIYVMNADGSAQRRLTSGSRTSCGPSGCTFPLFNPAWSPDGTKIAFGSDRDGSTALYVMNADGSNQKQIAQAFAADPDWQPAVELALGVTTSPRRIQVGRQFTYRLTVVNGSVRAATGVMVDLGLSSKLSLARASTCTRGRQVSCAVGTVAARSSATISVHVFARRPGRAVTTVTVHAAEADAIGSNNRRVLRTVVVRRKT